MTSRGEKRNAPRLYAECVRLARLGRRADALALARQLRPLLDADPDLLDALGTFFSYCGAQRLALECYERALILAPTRAVTRFNRAAVRRFLGDLAGAEADYDAVIAAGAADYEAWLNRSELRVQTAERNHVPELEALISKGVVSWSGEVQLRYALAKEYEDLEQYAASWVQLEQGARLRRLHLQYDIERDVQTVEWICEAFPEVLAPPAAGAVPAPIFIVGLPRSGSTLIERILGCHSDVTAAGELDDFALALTEAIRSRCERWPVSRQELIQAAARLDPAALGLAYLGRARPPGLRTAHFTDKMPLNYLYCGLIARALPGVRIIHAVRAPMATCYSMYKTLFKQGYPFSYDLTEIGRYHNAYRRLMRHWRETLPGQLLEVSYERLIGEQRGETERLLRFCGLKWEGQCLEFQKSTVPTMTASAAQVRRELYRTSLAQWRHYERELRPLAQILASADR